MKKRKGVDFNNFFLNIKKISSKKRIINIKKTKFKKFDFWQDRKLTKNKLDINDSLFQYKGRYVSIYLPEQRNDLEDIIKYPEKGNKFHIAECKTIIDKKDKGENDRFLLSNSLDGKFTISKDKKEVRTKLFVCRYCLETLNYQKFSDLNKDEKDKIVKEFSLKEFFLEHYSTIKELPVRTVPYSNEYTEDWEKISKDFRKSKDYVCENCKVSFKKHRNLLHTHHKDRIKTNNRDINLKALCKDCHSKEPNHSHIVITNEELNIIYNLRKEQKKTKHI